MPISIALLGNALVVTMSLAVLGWNAAGAHAVARNTARFSSLWCAAALASPGLSRISRGLPGQGRLIQAFVAAHVVHFAVVAALLLSFERTHIAQRPWQGALVIAIGSSVILGLGLTAESANPFSRVVRSIALYSASLIFFLAFFRHAVRSLRGIAVLLVCALILRATSHLTLWNERLKAN